jgi:hypothetical protein
MTSNLGTEPLLAALSSHTTIKDASEEVMQKVCAFVFLDCVCASFSYKYHEVGCGALTCLPLNVVAG